MRLLPSTCGLASLSLVALLLTGCPPPCGPGSCFGCCDSSGQCLPSQASQCGENGAACMACQAGQVCAAGVCTSANLAGGSAGGTSTTGGGTSGGSSGGVVGGGTSGGRNGGGTTGGGTSGGFGGGVVGGGTAGGSTTCTLPTGLPGTRCSGACVDVGSNNSNCGGCNRPCSAGTSCQQGTCRPTVCTSGSFCSLTDGGFGSCCDGVCHTFGSDPSACGGCGQSCPTALCVSSSCVARCGADGGVCGTGTECVSRSGSRFCASTTCGAGSDGFTCSLGGERAGMCCSGACVDTSQSPNCGRCGVACTGAQQCLNSTCQTSANCSTAPVDTTCAVPDGGAGFCCGKQCERDYRNDQNCGVCGRGCAPGTTCTNGQCLTPSGTFPSCSVSCPSGTTCVQNGCFASDCSSANTGQYCGPFANGRCCGGSACADLSNSSQHCGSCGRACAAGQFCANGTCQPIQTCTLGNDGTACPLGSGISGVCCGAACIDTRTSTANCGQCGGACGVGATCSNSQCVTADGGSSSCVIYSTGGEPCAAGKLCVNNRCQSPSCQPGASGGACAFGVATGNTPPKGTCCQGRCVDVNQDSANCGTCGTPCNGLCEGTSIFSQLVCLPPAPSTTCRSCQNGTFCLGNQCVPTSCNSGFQGSACLTQSMAVGQCCGFLSTQCLDVRTDSQNCGGCGVRCASGSVCIAGVCQSGGATCQRGDLGRFCNLDAGVSHVCCPGAGCIDTLVDDRNCGGCGNACTQGLSCQQGRCVAATCTSATSQRPCNDGDGGVGSCCGLTCAQLSTDPNNCGQCGRLCALGEVCQGGNCALANCSTSTAGAPCHTGTSVGSCCGTSCVSTRSDPLNCGACNRQCPADAGCASGMCR